MKMTKENYLKYPHGDKKARTVRAFFVHSHSYRIDIVGGFANSLCRAVAPEMSQMSLVTQKETRSNQPRKPSYSLDYWLIRVSSIVIVGGGGVREATSLTPYNYNKNKIAL